MPEIGTSGSMSGDGKRSAGLRPQATAPILDSTELKATSENSVTLTVAEPMSVRGKMTRSRLSCVDAKED